MQQLYTNQTTKEWYQVVQYSVVTVQLSNYLYNKGMALSCTVLCGHSTGV